MGEAIISVSATCALNDTPVLRETSERGAMLIRIVESHFRFGHVGHFFYCSSPESVKQLAGLPLRNTGRSELMKPIAMFFGWMM